MPCGAQRAEQVVEHRLQARGLQPGRVDLDQQRAHVAHTLAQRVDGIVDHARLLVVAAPARVGRQRREPERHARQVLHHAVVQVGGDPAALAVGRLDRARQQPLALLVAALQAARERPRERHLEEQQHEQAAEQRRRERAEHAAGADALTELEALVDLEQHLGAVRRADRRVRLQQLALLALVAVLGLGQVAELGVGAAGLEQLRLLLAEREPLADQRAARRSRGSCRRAPRASRARPTRRGSGPGRRRRVGASAVGVAGQHAVAERRGLDEPALDLRPARACRARPPRSPPPRSAKKPPTRITAIAARLPSMNRVTADATRGGVRCPPITRSAPRFEVLRGEQLRQAGDLHRLADRAVTGHDLERDVAGSERAMRSSSRPPSPVLSMNSISLRSSRRRSQSSAASVTAVRRSPTFDRSISPAAATMAVLPSRDCGDGEVVVHSWRLEYPVDGVSQRPDLWFDGLMTHSDLSRRAGAGPSAGERAGRRRARRPRRAGRAGRDLRDTRSGRTAARGWSRGRGWIRPTARGCWPTRRPRSPSSGSAAARASTWSRVENTPEVHNLVVCTLCSCYPWSVLGLPPVWYKSAPYRSRAVSDPRGVLADFGVTLGDDVTIRVWDSTAEVRYLVVPMRPGGDRRLVRGGARGARHARLDDRRRRVVNGAHDMGGVHGFGPGRAGGRRAVLPRRVGASACSGW